MKWILIANTNDALIYEFKKKPEKPKLIKEIFHDENKLKTSQIVSDRQGHYNTSHASRGAYSPKTDPTQVNLDNFARELAQILNDARVKQKFDEIFLIIPAQMEGTLFHHLDKNTKAFITKTIQKNIMHLSEHELENYIEDHVCKKCSPEIRF